MLDDGLFRFGFIADVESRRPFVLTTRDWKTQTVGTLRIAVHPEQQLITYDCADRQAVLLGICFAIGSRDLKSIIEEVMKDPDDTRPLDDLSGRFCLLISIDDDWRVFNDPIGSQTVFYSLSETGCMASHSELLADYLGSGLRDDVRMFKSTPKFKGLSVKYLPGDLTSYKDVFGLIPNHHIDLKTGLQKRYWPRENLPFDVERSDFDDRCSIFFEALAAGLKDRETYLGITGGIDTRVVCAGLFKEGHPFHGMTWLGNYIEPEEDPVVKELISRMKIPHSYIDLPGPADEIARASGRNSGNFRGMSRLTSAVAAQVGRDDDAIFVRGYGGEIIRGFYNLLRQPLVEYSADEFSRIYAFKSKMKEPDPDFDSFTLAAFEEFCERGGYKEISQSFDHDVNDIMYWEHRMGMWGAAMLNEMDAAIRSIVGINDRRLFELAFCLPPKERLRKSFLKSVVERLDDRLAGIPIQ